jgi:O-antigen/teichoic acid export membrane protein
MAESLRERFFRGTFVVGMGNLCTMILGLASTVVIARLLPAETFGAFILLLVTGMFLARMSSFGLELAMPKFLSDTVQEQARSRIVNTVILFRLLTIALVSLLALGARSWLALLFGETLLTNLIGFVPLLFLAISLGQLMRAILQGFLLFRLVALTDALASLLNFVFILSFTLGLDQGLAGLIVAKTLSLLIATLVVYLRIPIIRRLELRFEHLSPMLKFSFPLQINDTLNFVFQRLDVMLIGMLIGVRGVAYYEIARKIPESLNSLYEAFHSVYFPIVARLSEAGRRPELAQVLNHSLRLMSFIGLFSALIAILSGAYLIPLLFSAQYAPSVPVFNLLMVVLVLTLLDSVLGYSLVAVGDTGKPPLINSARALIVFMSYMLLIPALGLNGAPLANLIGLLLANPFYVWFLQRRQVQVDLWGYIKPWFAFGVSFAPFIFWPAGGWLPALLAITIFLSLGFVSASIRRTDLVAIANETRSVAGRYFRPRAGSSQV